MDPKTLHRLISLTFDSNPEVRKQAALKLADVDDPGAAFALLELSYDKNEEVASIAKSILEKKSKKEPKLMSFADLFEQGSPKEEKSELEKKEVEYKKILDPIDRIFEKTLGKERAKNFKVKILPQILKNMEKKEIKKQEHKKEVVQEVLLAYLEELGVEPLSSKSTTPSEIKELNEIKVEREQYKPLKDGVKAKPEESSEIPIEEISSSLENSSLIEKEIKEAKDDRYFTVEYEGEKIDFDVTIKPVFQIALNTFLETENEAIMKKQLENIKKFYINQIELAFRIAKDKLKKKKLVHITKIRDGMRRIYTDLLTIVSIKKQSYMRTKKKRDVFLRIVVRDNEGDEGVIYLFDGRGAGLTPGMRIKIENGKAKYFSFSGETAIVLPKSGKIIAEF